ncbi:unnamed protein product [Coffea canephora]|uniref:PROP1-like PPR domain-containing protein n=1 Tax=Coffea canephora TaxID=49390 RepID=A0A068V809_COFCA|nr:unnamed protein product [Coffea canephora]
MEALSTWPSKNESWLVPQLDVGLGSSPNCTTRKLRRKRLILAASLSHIRVGLTGIGSRTCCFKCQNWDSRSKLFCNYSTRLLCDPKRGSLGASFALNLVLEEQATGNHVRKDENSASTEGVSVGSDHGDFTCVAMEEQARGVRLTFTGDDIVTFSAADPEKEQELNSEEVVGIEKDARRRIDVRALGWSLHKARSVDDVDEVLKGKGELPLQVYSSLIRAFGKEKRLDSAMALVEWLKRKSQVTNGAIRPNLFIYNSLLGAVKQAEKYDAVEQVMNDMTIEGVHPNVITYNTLMGIYIEQGQEVEALTLFEEMPKKGLSPTPASYSTALLAYQRLEDGFGAVKFFIEVREKFRNGEIEKDVNEDWDDEFSKLENFTTRICHQVMRRWLIKSENSGTDILKLLTEMDKAGLQTSRAEHERLVWACTHEEHHLVAKELYKRIRERDMEISLSVCNHIIWLMGKAKKWWAALEIYEDLLDKGPKPNNMSYELVVSHFNILLAAARKRGIWRWGVRLLNKMEEKGLKPGSREWNSVLVACSKASEASAAVQIFKRMIEQGEKPTVISYGSLLSALEKGKLYEEALQVWKHMVKVGVAPNLYAYTIMASIYTAQGKFNIVNSIIREMVAAGVEPTVVTFNAIISGCARNHMGSAAYEWFQRMKVHSISPNEVTYEMLIEALTNDAKPRLAYELYLRGQNEGLSLSSKAYDAIIRSSNLYGATIDVSSLGPRPLEKKKKVQIRRHLSDFCSLADVPRRSKPFDGIEIYSVHHRREDHS